MRKNIALIGVGFGLSIVYIYFEDWVWRYRRNKRRSTA